MGRITRKPNFEEKPQYPVLEYEPTEADRAFELDSPRSLERLFNKTFSEDTLNGFYGTDSYLVYINLVKNENTPLSIKLKSLLILRIHFSALFASLKEDDRYYDAKNEVEWITIYSDNEKVVQRANDVLALF